MCSPLLPLVLFALPNNKHRVGDLIPGPVYIHMLHTAEADPARIPPRAISPGVVIERITYEHLVQL